MLSLHSPLRVETRCERCFAVQGTSGDCVVMGVCHLMERLTEMILSGHQLRRQYRGGDGVLGHGRRGDRTRMLLGIPSIALSQEVFHDRDAVPWATARALAPDVIRRLAPLDWSAGESPERQLPRLPSRTGRTDDADVHMASAGLD
ncbi:MAG: 5'/3'-nucleotidase SurE [Thermomicrobiales bacterium]